MDSSTLAVAVTGHSMIIHHPRRLHECITDGAAHETEATLLQVLAHGIGFGRTGRGAALPLVLLGATAHERPDVLVEAAEFLLHFQERLCVTDSALDLEAVANYP